MLRYSFQVLLFVCPAVGTLLMAAAADDSSRPSRKWAEALKVSTPYVAGEMPTADELWDKSLAKFAEAEAWSADVDLHFVNRAPPKEMSYRGKLTSKGNRLRAELKAKNGASNSRLLVIVDANGIAWTEWRSDESIRVSKQSLNQSTRSQASGANIGPLPGVGFLAGPRRRRSETHAACEVVNQGASELKGSKVYLLEATVKDDTEPGSREDRPRGAKWVTVMSAIDAMPAILASISVDGESRTLVLRSYDLEAEIDDARFIYVPAEGAIVVDMDAPATPHAEVRKNPVAYGAESIARGKRLYLADCVVCHSIDGTGRDSDVTDNAADLTDTEYWLSDGSEGATFLAIRDGTGDEMPGYKDDYRDEKMIWDLVNYIRRLQKAK